MGMADIMFVDGLKTSDKKAIPHYREKRSEICIRVFYTELLSECGHDYHTPGNNCADYETGR